MKLRIEIDPEADEEVIIRAHSLDEGTKALQEAIARAVDAKGEIAVRSGDRECYIPYREVLFFETDDGRVTAHTARERYLCPMRISELADLLPRTFARAAKGCLINTAHIRSISRSPTGVSTATFAGSDKTVFISRMYYKIVREIIEETRI